MSTPGNSAAFAPTDAERVTALARALNQVQHALMTVPLDEMARIDARSVARARQAAIDALTAAGLEVWT